MLAFGVNDILDWHVKYKPGTDTYSFEKIVFIIAEPIGSHFM